LLHFFLVDPAVPEKFRAAMKDVGLCRDEYNRTDHWMPQLYVRSALRMQGKRVLTERDVVSRVWRGNPQGDTIGVGDYTVDVPGPVQTIIDPLSGEVVNEGALKVPTFCDPGVAPFALPYSAMLPRLGEAFNLVVPVAVSTSHIAFNSIRLEPQWMALGHAAGVAAAMSLRVEGRVGAIDVAGLQRKLKEQGQVLIPRNLTNASNVNNEPARPPGIARA